MDVEVTRDADGWTKEAPARWDAAKAAAFGDLPPALFGLGTPADGDPLADEWWRAEDGRGVIGYGRLDDSWGDAEILIIVHPDRRGAGLGSVVLDHLEREAGRRHLNYVYNVVPLTHPDREEISAWLRAHGFEEKADGELRKRVPRSDVN
ncbi:GNAT family N-acetyltransferase [Pseudonocardia halophobica]|uniref:GNAT family N-acetyltransferase n=1 Tax=Pseudonocardia halophobica TaxID=29401 RepID=UPI003D8F411B